jgi:ribosome biogenesis GTPase A
MDMYQKREMRKNKKMDESTKSLPSTSINWYPGHMAKAKRQISEIINLIDVVLEVVDARIPKSSKIIDIDQYTKSKPRIMIMTKYDLCDKK